MNYFMLHKQVSLVDSFLYYPHPSFVLLFPGGMSLIFYGLYRTASSVYIVDGKLIKKDLFKSSSINLLDVAKAELHLRTGREKDEKSRKWGGLSPVYELILEEEQSTIKLSLDDYKVSARREILRLLQPYLLSISIKNFDAKLLDALAFDDSQYIAGKTSQFLYFFLLTILIIFVTFSYIQDPVQFL